jgi:hypothetical protein
LLNLLPAQIYVYSLGYSYANRLVIQNSNNYLDNQYQPRLQLI